MISLVVQKAQNSGARRAIVATDQAEVANVAKAAGAETVLTRTDHESSTERLAEAIDLLDLPDDEVFVNVQGKEPYIEPELIAKAAKDLWLHETDMATLATPVRDTTEATNPNVVKVVLDIVGNELYFSRAAISRDRDGGENGGANQHMLRHIGLYAYRAGFLKVFLTMQHTFLEHIEKLEQLRLLYHRITIHVSIVESAFSLGVDTEEDLEKAGNLFPQDIK